MSWTTCSAWRVQADGGREIVCLNDATSPDGALEIAVMIRVDDAPISERGHEGAARWLQIESLTASWMTPGALAEQLTSLSLDPDSGCSYGGHVPVKFHASCERCHLCA
jgi:hypothetical protein